MNDEKYMFFSDCAEKKSIGASGFRKRTHTGKGGRARLPFESLTKKEIEKMNGETKTYRLNEPMPWKEFKAMPDDIKVMYIKLLREKFKVSSRVISDMMGAASGTLSREFRRLGINETGRKRNDDWDKEGWYAWCGLAPKPVKEELKVEEIPEEVSNKKSNEQIVEENLANEVKEKSVADMHKQERDWKCQEERKMVVPTTGTMVFDGLAEDVLESVRVLLWGANVHICVNWSVHENKDGFSKEEEI